jgi:hypothetical protein
MEKKVLPLHGKKGIQMTQEAEIKVFYKIKGEKSKTRFSIPIGEPIKPKGEI